MTTQVHLEFLGHATTLMDLGGRRIITDPVLTDRVLFLRRQTGHRHRTVRAVDVILISHHHHDHLHLPSLRRLDREAVVIGPAGTSAIVGRAGFDGVDVSAGDTVTMGELTITAVPAMHDGRRYRWAGQPTSIGFVIADRSTSVYFAGDTTLHRDMAHLGPVDVALLPVWGWGPRLNHDHMDPAQAADAVALIEPRLAVPIHWGTLWPMGGRFLRPHLLVQPPLDFARLVTQGDGTTKAEVVPPGSVLRMDRTAGRSLSGPTLRRSTRPPPATT